jgi:hypothetical protein
MTPATAFRGCGGFSTFVPQIVTENGSHPVRRWRDLSATCPPTPGGATTEKVQSVYRAGKRYYPLPDGSEVPSVSTFLGVIDKPALTKWKSKTVAEWAVTHRDAWASLPDEAAVKVLTDAPNYDTSARDSGDIAHKILEDLATGKDPYIPPGFESVPRAWTQFTTEFDVRVHSAEGWVASYDQQYSGSYDLMCWINGDLSLVDTKSGSGIYGSTAWQLCAYARADVILTPEADGSITETPMPEIKKTFGFWVRPSGWALIPLSLDQDTWNVVRASRMLFDLTANDWRYRGKPLNVSPIRTKGPNWLSNIEEKP